MPGYNVSSRCSSSADCRLLVSLFGLGGAGRGEESGGRRGGASNKGVGPGSGFPGSGSDGLTGLLDSPPAKELVAS